MSLKIKKKIKLTRPTLIAAWPGMGNVAIGAISYLRRKLNMVEIAEIDLSHIYYPDAILVEQGVGRLPDSPQSIFYASMEFPIVVYENEIQLGEAAGLSLINLALDFAQHLEVKKIITVAAFPINSSYKDRSLVYGVGGSFSVLSELRQFGIQILDRGSISGLNGLFLGYSQKRGFETLCLLATIPLYATNFINPRAWRAILEVLENMLGVRIDLTELDQLVAEIDQKLEQIEMQVQTFIENQKSTEEPDQVNPQILRRIEQLFIEARNNRDKALELKRLLDRYNLFERYEDRFLDLFKKE